jgi:hypothetical protein
MVEERLGGSLTELSVLAKIPSLNTIDSLEDLKGYEGKLVRFTGFVQDMLDNDYFIGTLKNQEELVNCRGMKYITVHDS